VWVCVCSLRYQACNVHAPYFHLWPARIYDIFPRYLINGTIFEKRYIIERKMCVFVQHCSESFLNPRRIERDIIKMYIDLHVKYPLFLSDLNETWTTSIEFRNILTYKITWKSVHWEPSYSMWTDGRTEG